MNLSHSYAELKTQHFFWLTFYKANKPYDACCFNNKLNFKKDMSKECSLYGIDEHPERKLK